MADRVLGQNQRRKCRTVEQYVAEGIWEHQRRPIRQGVEPGWRICTTMSNMNLACCYNNIHQSHLATIQLAQEMSLVIYMVVMETTTATTMLLHPKTVTVPIMTKQA